MVKLSEYLEGMRSSRDAAELEAAIQVPFKHSFRGRTWSQICKVRIEAGERIVADHPHKYYIPHFGERRLLTCCGESCKVGRGHNSTGIRYVWHGAGEWAQARLRENGFGVRAAHRLWESGWKDYPHRCIGLVEKILAGEVADPQLNVLIGHKGHSPIKYTLEANDADRHDRRAHRPCACGGTLFDWGGSFSEGFYFVNWHCNGCPDVFTEYMTRSQFYDLRRGARVAADA